MEPKNYCYLDLMELPGSRKMGKKLQVSKISRIFAAEIEKKTIRVMINSRHFMAYAFLVLEIIALLIIVWLVFLA
jgi:hypothetical protein